MSPQNSRRHVPKSRWRSRTCSRNKKVVNGESIHIAVEDNHRFHKIILRRSVHAMGI